MNDNTNNLLVSVPHDSPDASDRESPAPLRDEEQSGRDEAMEEEGGLESQIPDNVRVIIRSLIDHYELSRDQFSAMYDEYMKTKYLSDPDETSDDCHKDGPIRGSDRDRDRLRLHVVEEPTLARVVTDRGGNDTTVTNSSPMQDHELQGMLLICVSFISLCWHVKVKLIDYRVWCSLLWRHMSLPL